MTVFTLNARSCMSHLLLKDTFDRFSFFEGEITTFNKFTMDGFLHKDFFDEEPEYTYSYWKELREYCFSIIKEFLPIRRGIFRFFIEIGRAHV